jgi:hypothetical protein
MLGRNRPHVGHRALRVTLPSLARRICEVEAEPRWTGIAPLVRAMETVVKFAPFGDLLPPKPDGVDKSDTSSLRLLLASSDTTSSTSPRTDVSIGAGVWAESLFEFVVGTGIDPLVRSTLWNQSLTLADQ